MAIDDNIAKIRERMKRAAARAGRRMNEIALMAVCKTHPVEKIREAFAAGQRLFGENRVQEFAGKAPQVSGLEGATFRMIGHLQSNKAKPAAELFDGVDSVDSRKLADRLNAAAESLGKTLDILIEINVGGEEAKSGLMPTSPELDEILTHVSEWRSLRLRGLMTIPPFTEDPEGARPYFRQLRELRDAMARRNLSGVTMEQLSMGMSHDFEVAIEEGSTCVRVGTAIFGERPKP
jgi:pyridoxal phosphate enzyme (YggS family)